MTDIRQQEQDETVTSGDLNVTVATALPAGSNAIGTVQPGNTANSTPWLTTQSPVTTGGLSIYSASVGATKTQVKASAGQLYGWYIYNSNSSAAYVQFFDVANASITLGTTAPTFALGIPASSGANVFTDSGIAFATAINWAATTTRTGSTAPTNTVDVNFFYK